MNNHRHACGHPLGYLPGIEIFSTSSTHTYDGLIRFSTPKSNPNLIFDSDNGKVLGLSPYIIGDPDKGKAFETKYLTIEFKSVLDNLISEIEAQSTAKDLRSIDILICWTISQETFRGYEITEITVENIDERKYPGVTHLLTRLEDEHNVAVICLDKVIESIEA